MPRRTHWAGLALLATACFDPPEANDPTTSTTGDPVTTGSTGDLTTSGPAESSTGPSDPSTTDPDDTGPLDSTSSGDTTGPVTCDPGTYGPDCSGVCDCNDGECNDGAEGDGSCTCPAGTFGASCAGVCDCGEIVACDDGAQGTGLCLCPDPVGTFTVAYLPGWGPLANPDLAYMQLQTNWMTYGACQPQLVEVLQPFTEADLVATGAHVVVASNPSGGNDQYSPAEILAVRNYVMGGNAGFLSTYLLVHNGVDNSALADLAGVDPLAHLGTTSIACGPTVDVLLPDHPLASDLPLSFPLVPAFANAQDMGGPWAGALLPGAEIVMQSDDALDVVIGYEGAGWRGTRIASFADYQSTPEGRQLLYNALLWSAYPP